PNPRILFVPYPLHDRDTYTKTARDKFKTLGLVEFSCFQYGLRLCAVLFLCPIGALYYNKLVTEIRKRVLEVMPFNINPHYLDPDPSSKHMGETHEQRIIQYHKELDTPLSLFNDQRYTTLLGCTKARLFQRGTQTTGYEPGSDLSFLRTDAQ
uniref:Uncharacterized protein n=1 Tax=Sinocyclocheilus grahami TaxID=75366 RepID=A0A672N634_SINGR